MSSFGPAKPGWLSSGDINPFSRGRRKPAGAHTISSSIGPNISMFVNAVYYPNWHIYKQRPPSSLRLDVISHIFYAFAW
jgi:chitinase